MNSYVRRDALDIEALYPTLAGPLRANVGRLVTAPEVVIEDACQIAWSRLLLHRREVAHSSVLAWLTTVAAREGRRAVRRAQREAGLEAGEEAGRMALMPSPGPGPERIAEMREQLDSLRHLPERQRRLVWLHGLGYDYVEIAARTGDSPRTVDRQLQRGRALLRQAAA
jgi:RNA polymerase sigma factor (sigma-70 family)